MMIRSVYILLISLFAAFAGYSQTTQISVVATTIQLKAYAGTNALVFVSDSATRGLFFNCVSCTVDEASTYLGVGGKKWNRFPAPAALLDSISDIIGLQDSLNAKQQQLNGLGFVKANGNVITYDNSTYMINPMTTTGDMIYLNGGVPVSRAIGTQGQVLTVSGGLPIWATPSLLWNGKWSVTATSTGNTTISSSIPVLAYVGSGNTWTLPALSASTNQSFWIKNGGTGALTVARGGTDPLFTDSSVASFTLAVGESVMLIPINGSWYSYFKSTASSGGSSGGSSEIIQITYAALDASSGLATDKIYRITDTDKYGDFKITGTVADQSADNIGTVIVNAGLQKLERMYSGAIDLRWFGLVQDAVAGVGAYGSPTGTDNKAVIDRAVAAAAANQEIICEGCTFFVGTKVNAFDGAKPVNIHINGTIYTAADTLFKVINGSGDYDHNRIWVEQIVGKGNIPTNGPTARANGTSPVWTNLTNTVLVVQNSNKGEYYFGRVWGMKHVVVLTSSGNAGCQENTFDGITWYNCTNHILQWATDATGYIDKNKFGWSSVLRLSGGLALRFDGGTGNTGANRSNKYDLLLEYLDSAVNSSADVTNPELILNFEGGTTTGLFSTTPIMISNTFRAPVWGGAGVFGAKHVGNANMGQGGVINKEIWNSTYKVGDKHIIMSDGTITTIKQNNSITNTNITNLQSTYPNWKFTTEDADVEVSVSANYTLASYVKWITCTGTSAFTVTFPATSYSQRIVTVKNSSTATISVSGVTGVTSIPADQSVTYRSFQSGGYQSVTNLSGITSQDTAAMLSPYATDAQVNAKVDANGAITGATKTKITYDSKGLVTAGANAGVGDIAGLQDSLDVKVPTSRTLTFPFSTTPSAQDLSADRIIYPITDMEYAADLMGSSVGSKPHTLGVDQHQLTANTGLSDNRADYVAILCKYPITVSNFVFFTGTSGVFTGDGFNGLALFRDSAGTLIQIAITANDPNIWKGTAQSVKTVAFSGSPVSLTPGIYWAMVMYNNDQVTTPSPTIPTLGVGQPFGSSNQSAMDYTNSRKYFANQSSQSSAPSTKSFTLLSASTTKYWIGLN